MRNLFILFSMLTLGCSPIIHPPNDPRSISGIHPEFQPFVNDYIEDKGSELSYDIPIQFGKLNNGEVGVCTRWDNGYRQILIDEKYWNSWWTNDHERKNLIYHELGHCDLNREHDETLRDDDNPYSIMYPYVFDIEFDSEYYIEELFTNI